MLAGPYITPMGPVQMQVAAQALAMVDGLAMIAGSLSVHTCPPPDGWAAANLVFGKAGVLEHWMGALFDVVALSDTSSSQYSFNRSQLSS